jgi:IS5 family transposase
VIFNKAKNYISRGQDHKLAEQILKTVTDLLVSKNLLLRTGTIVDATLIAAPSSTKNKTKSRDPEMHQTKKGNQWYFGMKAHIGVDADSGVVHTVRGTAANVGDVAEANSRATRSRKRWIWRRGLPGG